MRYSPASEITRSTHPGLGLAVGCLIGLGELVGEGAASALRLALGLGADPQFENSDSGLQALRAATRAAERGKNARRASGWRAERRVGRVPA